MHSDKKHSEQGIHIQHNINVRRTDAYIKGERGAVGCDAATIVPGEACTQAAYPQMHVAA